MSAVAMPHPHVEPSVVRQDSWQFPDQELGNAIMRSITVSSSSGLNGLVR